MTADPQGIEVAIDEIVLHGFSPAQRAAIVDSIRAEVTASVTGWRPGSAPPQPGEARPVSVDAGAGPSAVGRAVAAQVRARLAPPISGRAEVSR